MTPWLKQLYILLMNKPLWLFVYLFQLSHCLMLNWESFPPLKTPWVVKCEPCPLYIWSTQKWLHDGGRRAAKWESCWRDTYKRWTDLYFVPVRFAIHLITNQAFELSLNLLTLASRLHHTSTGMAFWIHVIRRDGERTRELYFVVHV